MGLGAEDAGAPEAAPPKEPDFRLGNDGPTVPGATGTTSEPTTKPTPRISNKRKKLKKRRKRGGVRRRRFSHPVNVLRPGVIVKNASKKTLKVAKAKGFKVKEWIKLRGLGISLTRFSPPKGLSLSEAEVVLSQSVPGVQVGLNRKYRIYRAALRSPKVKDVPRGGARLRSACKKDHCLAQEIIGWRSGLTKCARRLRVGIVDTAVELSHPAFARKRITARRNKAAGKGKEDVTWHGTGVLALLAGDAKSGTPGLIPDASFFVADAFYADEEGQLSTDTVSLLKAFNWLRRKKVQLINLSLAGPADELVEGVIRKMSASGVIFVAAVGNAGPRGPRSFPAGYDDVIAVTAVDKDLRAYRYASQGEHVDIAAPGVSVWTALPGGRSGYRTGTSFAAPFVTAATAAIYRSLPKKTKSNVLEQLSAVDLGEAGTDTVYGRGLLLAPDSCGGGAVAEKKKQKKRRAPTVQSDATAGGAFTSRLAQ